MQASSQVFLLGLNEINFEYVKAYIAQGHLPGFARLIGKYGILETHSENEYEQLEPWIQWVTIHTGKTYAEHQVFRLGDIVGQPIPQLFEELESKGVKVGAISPMNAENRLKSSPYFVPDPWTKTQASGGALLRALARAISEMVNDNAHDRFSVGSALTILAGLMRYAHPRHYAAYIKLIGGAMKQPWKRAMLLDLLLFDLHAALFRKHRPDFSMLFVNAGAHIQHHYFFSSPVVSSDLKNPNWYIKPGKDPVLEIYALYDRLLIEFIDNNPETRVIMATGLRQIPYPIVKFYYRLKDHLTFLRQAGIKGVNEVQPRMSRDFVIIFETEEAAANGEMVLREARVDDGTALFGEVDNRGKDIFVTLTYPKEIKTEMGAIINGRHIEDLSSWVSLVAIKNGQHDSTGYVIDTGCAKCNKSAVPLNALFEHIMTAVGT